MIFIPYDEEYNYKYYINDTGQIVVSKEYDDNESIVCYRTYFPNLDYNYSTRCDDRFNYGNTFELVDFEKSTQDIYYRVDITNILICTLILLLIFVYLPYKIISRLFGRWLKL